MWIRQNGQIYAIFIYADQHFMHCNVWSNKIYAVQIYATGFDLNIKLVQKNVTLQYLYWCPRCFINGFKFPEYCSAHDRRHHWYLNKFIMILRGKFLWMWCDQCRLRCLSNCFRIRYLLDAVRLGLSWACLGQNKLINIPEVDSLASQQVWPRELQPFAW